MKNGGLVWYEDGHTYRPVDDVVIYLGGDPLTKKAMRWVVDENGDMWWMPFYDGKIWPSKSIPEISGVLMGKQAPRDKKKLDDQG